jgi:hypothetical protein
MSSGTALNINSSLIWLRIFRLAFFALSGKAAYSGKLAMIHPTPHEWIAASCRVWIRVSEIAYAVPIRPTTAPVS